MRAGGLIHEGVPLAHCCVLNNSLAALKVIIDCGLSLETVTAKCRLTVLQEAIERELFSIFQLLVTAGANVKVSWPEYAYSRTALHVACQLGNIHMVKVLLNAGMDVRARDKLNMSPFSVAAQSPNGSNVLQLLIDRCRVDLNERSALLRTPLHLACAASQAASVAVLLNANADIDVRDRNLHTPLMLACWSRFHDGIKKLLDVVADPNICSRDGSSPLAVAVRNNDVQAIELLLGDVRVNIEERSLHLSTPLLLACRFGSLDALR